MKCLIWLFAASALCACSYPTSSIEQGAEAAHLRFFGAAGTTVLIDHQDRGVIDRSGSLTIDVEPGKHLAEEAVDGRVVLHRDYEVSAGSNIEIGG